MAKVSKTPKKSSGPPLKPPTNTNGGKDDGSKVVGRSQPGLADDIPAPPKKHEYYPDELTLYGFKLNTIAGKDVAIRHDELTLRLLAHATGSDGDRPVSLAVVYGYAYEGHCYRLDRARLFIVDSGGQVADGCGFADPYSMWRIRARANVMEVAISHDTAEVLILDASMPGNKSPNTYRNDMQLAHRGGKLNRPGGA